MLRQIKTISLSLLAVVLVAANANADTSNMIIGARSQGMGGAFAAAADGASASYWNPAGLSRLSRAELTYSYWAMSDVEGIGVNFAAIVAPFTAGGFEGGIGFSVVRVGADLEEGPSLTTNGISDSRYSVTGALKLHDQIAVGMSLNRLQVSSDRESGAGFGIDAAVSVQPFVGQALHVAVVGRNLSADIKNEDLDESWRIGLAWAFSQNRIHVAGDTHLRKDINGDDGYSGLFYGGIEVTPVQQLSLRGGGSSESQYGFGFGVNHRNVAVDYAYDDDDVLGNSHRVSVSFQFGRPNE